MAGFAKGTKKKISSDLFNKLQRNSAEYREQATVLAKAEVRRLDVFDTGRTLRNTFAEVAVKPNVSVIISLITRWEDGGDSFFYPIFPFFGLGTSRRYGPRKWLEKARTKLAKQITK